MPDEKERSLSSRLSTAEMDLLQLERRMFGLRKDLDENTELCSKIKKDTAELVEIFKNAKGANKLFISIVKWATIVAVFVTALITALRSMGKGG